MIYSIYKAVEAEIVEHVKPLSKFMAKHDDVPDTVKRWLARMQAMTSLFSTAGEVHRSYPATLSLPLLPNVESGCEACSLAVMGGRPDVLFDLRASLLSRGSKKGKKEPRLLRYVEAWLENCEHIGVLRDTSSFLGSEIKTVRKEQRREHHKNEKARAERRQTGRSRGDQSKSSGERKRHGARTPSSIAGLYATKTNSHENRSRREDSSPNVDIRLGSLVSADPRDYGSSTSPISVASTNELGGPVSPVSLGPRIYDEKPISLVSQHNHANNQAPTYDETLAKINREQEVCRQRRNEGIRDHGLSSSGAELPRERDREPLGFEDILAKTNDERERLRARDQARHGDEAVKKRAEGGYLPWAAEDDMKRMNDLMDKYKP